MRGLRAGIQSDPALDRAIGEAEVVVSDYVGDEVDEHVQVPIAGTGGLPIWPSSTQPPSLAGLNISDN